MELYFLRHGKAVELGEPGARDDFHRALTPNGVEETAAEAETLLALAVRPDLILTSPLVRANQTAKIVAERLAPKKGLIETDLLAPECDLSQLRKLLEQHAGAESVMLVGHEPDLSTLVGELIAAQGARVEMKKGGIAAVQVRGLVQPGGGLLQWLAPPKLLMHSRQPRHND
jgi:phosphohistidine phosphatase